MGQSFGGLRAGSNWVPQVMQIQDLTASLIFVSQPLRSVPRRHPQISAQPLAETTQSRGVACSKTDGSNGCGGNPKTRNEQSEREIAGLSPGGRPSVARAFGPRCC